MNENKSITIDGEEVEWTKDGVEQILATVGIQCVYNSDVSPPAHLQPSQNPSTPFKRPLPSSYPALPELIPDTTRAKIHRPVSRRIRSRPSIHYPRSFSFHVEIARMARIQTI